MSFSTVVRAAINQKLGKAQAPAINVYEEPSLPSSFTAKTKGPPADDDEEEEPGGRRPAARRRSTTAAAATAASSSMCAYMYIPSQANTKKKIKLFGIPNTLVKSKIKDFILY